MIDGGAVCKYVAGASIVCKVDHLQNIALPPGLFHFYK